MWIDHLGVGNFSTRNPQSHLPQITFLGLSCAYNKHPAARSLIAAIVIVMLPKPVLSRSHSLRTPVGSRPMTPDPEKSTAPAPVEADFFPTRAAPTARASGWRGYLQRCSDVLVKHGVEERGIVPLAEDVGGGERLSRWC